MSTWRWLGRRRGEDDLRREIAAHIAERIDDLVEQGLSKREARAIALREFGNPALSIERSREQWIAPWLSSVAQDLRYAVRSFARQPAFALSAVAVLALGIAPVTALFTMFNATVFKPWPVRDPSSIAIVRPVPGPREQFGSLSSLEYRYLRDHARSVTQLATWMPGGGPIAYRTVSVDFIQSQFVSANYFAMLGVGMHLGRPFLPEEEDYTAPRAVAIISERIWRERFGGSPSIIGDTVLVYDRPFTVVGVAEAGFFDVTDVRRDLWMPRPSVALMPYDPGRAQLKALADPRGNGVEQIGGRLAPGISREGARAELEVLSRQFRRDTGQQAYGLTLRGTRPIDLGYDTLRPQMPAYAMVTGALVLVMLLACANVGNLLLARGLSRQREIAIRMSLGASRSRVTRQLGTEALLLSAAAGAIGLALGMLALRFFVVTQRPAMLANPDLYLPDLGVAAFAIAMALVASVASAAMPAARSTRTGMATRANETAASRGGTGRWRTALLSAQLAISMVLLVGASLLTRAVGHALTADPGFAIQEVQAVAIRLPEGTPRRRELALAGSLRAALAREGLPIASSEFTAITTAQRLSTFRGQPGPQRLIVSRDVSGAYFDVLGVPLVAGRTMDDGRVDEAVVNESAARLFWPDEEALGKTLVTGDGDKAVTYTVVGIAKDVPVTSLSQLQPVVYQPLRAPGLLLARDRSAGIVDRIAAIARGIEPSVKVTARPLSDDIKAATAGTAVAGQSAWAIGAFALMLATAGAYGVFAYMVEERRREIGVRMALGARAHQVVWTIMAGARWPLACGIGAGLLMAAIAAPILRRFLYGLSPFDPVAYLGVCGMLVTAALLATWVPATRATRIDPAMTLRAD